MGASKEEKRTLQEQQERGSQARNEFVQRQQGFAARMDGEAERARQAAEDALVNRASERTDELKRLLDDVRPPAGSQQSSTDGSRDRTGGATAGRGSSHTVAR